VPVLILVLVLPLVVIALMPLILIQRYRLGAFSGAAAGVVLGLGLGVLGLLLTHWEPTPATLHFTPNRWLVLLVTVMVSVRIAYGFWRSLQAARAGIYGSQMVLAFGIPESLAVGGAVIGYYVAYAVGVRRRVGQWQRRALRVL
jgi:hypothetical protein